MGTQVRYLDSIHNLMSHNLYFTPGGMQNIPFSMSLCMYDVCMYVCLHILKATCPNFMIFSVCVIYGHGSVLL